MGTNRYFKLAIRFLLLITILFGLSTCNKNPDSVPPATSNNIVIAQNAKFITDSDWQNIIQTVDSSNFTLTGGNDLLSKYSLKQGDLIVSSYGNGLLRKVESILQSGNGVQIQTSQATLTDLIKQGSIDFQGHLTLPKAKKSKNYYPGFSLDSPIIKSSKDLSTPIPFDLDIAPMIHMNGCFTLKGYRRFLNRCTFRL